MDKPNPYQAPDSTPEQLTKPRQTRHQAGNGCCVGGCAIPLALFLMLPFLVGNEIAHGYYMILPVLAVILGIVGSIIGFLIRRDSWDD